jgi:hypothetical protein
MCKDIPGKAAKSWSIAELTKEMKAIRNNVDKPQMAIMVRELVLAGILIKIEKPGMYTITHHKYRISRTGFLNLCEDT